MSGISKSIASATNSQSYGVQFELSDRSITIFDSTSNSLPVKCSSAYSVLNNASEMVETLWWIYLQATLRNSLFQSKGAFQVGSF